MKKNAFTLAEVLITLVIIGVIAAMTIPTLMGSTNEQEYKARDKKALSALNQALQLEKVLYGNRPDYYIAEAGDFARGFRMLQNHLSVVEGTGETVFKTADGVIFAHYNISDGLFIDPDGEKNGICGIDENAGNGCIFVRLEWPYEKQLFAIPVDQPDARDWLNN